MKRTKPTTIQNIHYTIRIRGITCIRCEEADRLGTAVCKGLQGTREGRAGVRL